MKKSYNHEKVETVPVFCSHMYGAEYGTVRYLLFVIQRSLFSFKVIFRSFLFCADLSYSSRLFLAHIFKYLRNCSSCPNR